MTDAGLPAVFDDRILRLHDKEVRLLCSDCRDCGRQTFPPSRECPICGGEVRSAELPGEGVLYSHTELLTKLTVHPVPMTVVQVELADGVLATGPLVSGEAEIGARVRIVPNVIESEDLDPYTAFAWART